MYRVSEAVRTTHGPDGAVVLDIKQGRLLRLNITGSVIFQGLQRGETEAQIIEGIRHHFCISRDLAHADVTEFLESMEQEGLIHSATSTEGQ